MIAFTPAKSRLVGCLPAGWYPAGLVFDGRRHRLCVANIKGSGADRGGKADVEIRGKTVRGYNTKSKIAGSVSLIQPPKDEELAAITATVLANNRRLEAQRVQARPARTPRRGRFPSGRASLRSSSTSCTSSRRIAPTTRSSAT